MPCGFKCKRSRSVNFEAPCNKERVCLILGQCLLEHEFIAQANKGIINSARKATTMKAALALLSRSATRRIVLPVRKSKYGVFFVNRNYKKKTIKSKVQPYEGVKFSIPQSTSPIEGINEFGKGFHCD